MNTDDTLRFELIASALLWRIAIAVKLIAPPDRARAMTALCEDAEVLLKRVGQENERRLRVLQFMRDNGLDGKALI